MVLSAGEREPVRSHVLLVLVLVGFFAAHGAQQGITGSLTKVSGNCSTALQQGSLCA